MPDPERYVESFSKQVEEWREWRAKWEHFALKGSGVPGDGFFEPYKHFTAKLLKDLDTLFDTQEKVNVMMLAAIDDLKRQLEQEDS